ncbi:DNA polymerase III subunit delta, partial [Saccharothrix sp. MB29]|nr:DNA polymerase III subunit delta [Saccharothrix sp. MB29]
LQAARAADPQADLTRVRVTDLTPPELAELVSPSLFAEGRVVALEAAQEAGKEIADAVIAHAKAPADGVTLVVVHSGGGRSKAAKADPEAVAALIEAVGSDLRELAAAASQLVADTGGKVDAEAVRRYHRGRAEVTGFAVAEKAVMGDRAGALEALRSASQLGVPHGLVADALADAVRTGARV